MSNTRLQYLFERHVAKTCTEAEKQELSVMLLSPQYAEAVKKLLEREWQHEQAVESMPAEKAEAIINAILTSSQQPVHDNKKSTIISLWRKVAVAAAVIVLAGTGYYFLFNKKDNTTIAQVNTPNTKSANEIVAPANSKAKITLVDGSTVPIDSIISGTLATQGNVNLVKTANGQIIYNAAQNNNGQIQYNTLTNPKGSRVVDMTLADGTRVWLNAGSSVTYPVAFVGKERSVSITGEAYFEVTHNAAMPFKVHNNKTEITDLGTSFNVNAYDNEADLKVTLLEGIVAIKNADQGENTKAITMKPGEQAQVASGIKIVKGVDMEKVMAWKNGVFNFQDASLEEVMRQLERWYDIDVVYEKDIPKLEFVGKMSRELTLSNVLHGLEVSKVHFRVEQGRKVVVMP